MIKIFKDINYMYYAMSSGLGVIMALALVYLGINPVASVIIVALWIFFCTFVFNKMASKRIAKLNALRDDCRTDSFIQAYREILEKLSNKGNSSSLVKLNLAAGYLDKGDVDSAIQTLSSVEIGGPSEIGRATASVYHSNYALAFLKMGDFTRAKQALGVCRNIIETSKFPESDKEKILGNCRLRQAQIDVAECNMDRIEEAEKVLLDFYNQGTTKLSKVTASYWLARLYYIKGDIVSENQMLRYTAENGGDCMCGVEARRILADESV